MFEDICKGLAWCPPEVLQSTLELAVEIAREGREGRRIGTIFIMGFTESVLRQSRPLILDPIALHPIAARHISDPNLRGTLKELAQLDGAFVLDESGLLVAACRYLDSVARGVDLPFGMGSRHMAAAYMSKQTGAIAIVVSESSIVRVFRDGILCAEILPELWLMSRHSLFMRGSLQEDQRPDMTIFTSKADDRS